MDAKPIRYLSVCSGIEAATVAWHPLGFEAAGFSEIEPFARAVLSHHYPNVPLFGDFTTLTENDYGAIDLLVGGTPCQSFSIAGLRRGLADDRGNLALGFIRLAQSTKPRWVVWENVPGVLSIDGGRTFGTFLGALAECGYGFAYRILDAQYFGVPQRRRRVFVIGYIGDWRPATAVLFERESLQRDITPRRETRENSTSFTQSSIGGYREGVGTIRANGGDCGGGTENLITKKWPATIASTLNAHFGDKMGLEDQHALNGAELFVPARAYNVTYCDANGKRKDRPNGGMYVNETEQSKTVTAGGDRSTYIAFEPGSIARNAGPTDLRETCSTLRAEMGDNQPAVLADMAVRRLTPRECERLQGFPDDYTLIPYRGKPAADGPRYKALGNSMHTGTMRWLGERIKKVDAMMCAP